MNDCYNILKLLFITILGSQLFFLLITNDVSRDLQSTIVQPKTEKQCLILYWTPIFGNYKQWGQGPKCKYCYGTTDRDLLNISDVVYFHYGDINENDLPTFRKPNQLYICLYMESVYFDKPRLKYFFNWTAHYRHDSDLFYPYGKVYAYDNKQKHKMKKPWLVDSSDIKIPKPNMTTIENVELNKTRSVAWIVSNCRTEIKREDYVERLSSYIDVDIYGGCGKLKCPYKNSRPGLNCLKMIESKYKFYIAFENSICVDYITEKLYAVLEYFIVPIVMGGGDYQSAAPPHSYINVKDYQNPKDLAKYLHYLKENRTAYNQYFEWKKHFTIGFFGMEEFGICAECAAIRNHLMLKKSSVVNLEDFYDRKKQCRSKL